MANLTDYEKKIMLVFNWRSELKESRVTNPYEIQALNRLVKKGVLETYLEPIVGGKIYRKVTK